VKIGVRYLAQLKRAAGVSAEEVEVAGPCGVAGFVWGLVERHPALGPLLVTPEGRLQPAILIFIGDEQVRRDADRPLRDGDVLTLLTPIAGGS
jgi:molybdopterin converting factor small subunit